MARASERSACTRRSCLSFWVFPHPNPSPPRGEGQFYKEVSPLPPSAARECRERDGGEDLPLELHLRRLLALRFGEEFFRDVARDFLIVRGRHREGGAALGKTAQIVHVTEHLRQRDLS